MADNRNSGMPLPIESEAWLSEHPGENRDELEEIWQLTVLADSFEPDPARVERIRSALVKRVAGDETIRRVVRLKSRFVWLAAAAVILVALGMTWWMQPIRFEAEAGGMLAVDLPDGSHVVLNSGASLERFRSFGWQRRSVNLEGEAFFDITEGRQPFIVTTFNSEVRVLGTRFNVRAWSTDVEPETRVFVEEGIVRLAARDKNGGATVLNGGESAIVRFGSDRPTDKVADSPAPSWRSGGMVFSGVPMRVILNEIERRHSVTVSVSPDSLEHVLVSLHVLRPADVGTILDLLAAAHELELTETPAGYLLTKQ